MKKIISLALVCVMMLGMLSMVSFADEVTFTVEKYGEGMENWSGSPNKGDAASATQVLICPKDAEGNKLTAAYENYTEIVWTLKFTDTNGVTKTVNLAPATCYDGGTWGILRFEPCLATGANKFVPAEGMTYTVEASFSVGGTTYKGVSADGYFTNKDGAAVDPDPSVPVLPDEQPKPEGPVTIVVGKYGSGMENWTGSPNKGDQEKVTQVLICPEDAEGNKIAAAYENYTEIVWTLKFTDTNGVTKTVNLAPATCYDGGSWGILRFEPCLGTGVNKFVPAEGMTYTVEASFTVDGVTYTGTSEAGAFTNGDGAAIDPDPSTPVIPDTPVTPDAPETGDATVFAIVFAAVAVLGMAVVVTKKVNA